MINRSSNSLFFYQLPKKPGPTYKLYFKAERKRAKAAYEAKKSAKANKNLKRKLSKIPDEQGAPYLIKLNK